MTETEDSSDTSSSRGCVCFQCSGEGKVMKKRRNPLPRSERHVLKQGKWLPEERICPSCGGSGIIQRTRKRNIDGSFQRKRVQKSFPSFRASGPQPVNVNSISPHLQPGPDEELCYLVGNWKIFQKLDRHRYSTDDVCTSFFSCEMLRSLGYERPLMLDIGCGIGSVLLTNAWQYPSALACVGIEAQVDRYELARRNVEYNVGDCRQCGGSSVQVFNADLRVDCDCVLQVCEQYKQGGYDLVTGTPPYFPPSTAVTPACHETSGCLFELKGGVEEYCKAASRYLRRPKNKSLGDKEVACGERPSIFALCNTAMASARVYSGCHAAGLSVVKRIDIVPKVGKAPLFNVFIAVANEWIDIDVQAAVQVFPQLRESTATNDIVNVNVCPRHYRFEGSARGETVETLTIRDTDDTHTVEYQAVLSSLSKPSSNDREKFDI